VNILLIGCGYVGKRVADKELARGNAVLAIVRSDESRQALQGNGVPATCLDLDLPIDRSAPATKGAGIYYFAPPPEKGQSDPRIRRFLESIGPQQLPERVVYISTTGIYGDCRGDWVDEERAPEPQADRSKRRLDAETALRDWSRQTGIKVVVLRVPGFYGPGKLPLARIRKGTPVLRESESPWSNRVHIDDLVATCLAAMHHPEPDDTYNISDGHPSTMTDYFNQVADAAGLPRPPEISLEQAKKQFSPELLSYLSESKRIDNTRMREKLCIEPAYPSLKDGLAAAIEGN
jgi:nucleoside-diphosphate-sugar epimerase